MKHSKDGTPRGRTAMGSIILTLVLLILPLFRSNLNFSPIIDFLGRFHPLIVHFPIVLILTNIILEWLFGSFKGPIGVTIIRMMYHWSAYSAVIAALLGYFLYQSGDYGGDLVKYHMWSGIGVAVLMIWCLQFRKLYLKTHRWRWRQLSRSLLLAAGIVVMLTGHQGGSLTHGPDFLLEPLQSALHKNKIGRFTVMKDPPSLKLYDDLIKPAFEKYCLKCHNPRNAKSDLDLSTLEAMEIGGKTLKPMIVRGNALESELFRRISLPPRHDEFMPPDGKPAMHPAEVKLVYHWIMNGANPTDSLGPLLMVDSLNSMIQPYLEETAEIQLDRREKRLERLKKGPRMAREVMKLGLEVRPDSETDSSYYILSMQFPPKMVTDDVLSKLAPHSDQFSRVSLVGAGITDEGLYHIGKMENLQQLILSRSCIKGSGLEYLRDLPKLETINLSHTDLTNENLLYLGNFPALKKVYVFNTEVTPEMVKVFNAHFEGIEVTFEEGDFY